MSNPYSAYSHHTQSSYGSSDHLEPETRQYKSHWSAEFDKSVNHNNSNNNNNNNKSSSNFVEKFSPPSTSRSYSPSIASSNAPPGHAKGETAYTGWQGRDSQYSEIGSLPSYHDSPDESGRNGVHYGKDKLGAFRKSLDSGNRARVYLFIAMVSSMMLLFLCTALIWLAAGVIKKPLVYGADNKVDHTTRPA